MLTDNERAELEKYRARKKKEIAYQQKYQKEKYRRVICLIPNDKADLFEQAKGNEPTSTYLNRLIDRDLKEKGLLTDQPE